MQISEKQTFKLDGSPFIHTGKGFTIGRNPKLVCDPKNIVEKLL